MKHSRGACASGAEENTSSTQSDGRPARGKGSLAVEDGRHPVARQFLPMFAIFRTDHQEFAIDRVAESNAMDSRIAGKGVEKKSCSLVRILQQPCFAAVRCFVNP